MNRCFIWTAALIGSIVLSWNTLSAQTIQKPQPSTVPAVQQQTVTPSPFQVNPKQTFKFPTTNFPKVGPSVYNQCAGCSFARVQPRSDDFLRKTWDYYGPNRVQPVPAPRPNVYTPFGVQPTTPYVPTPTFGPVPGTPSYNLSLPTPQ